MEANLRGFHSPLLERNSFQKILVELSETVAEASAIRDQKQTDDPELRMALGIVEAFLRRTHRLCYGGMAINSHMPKFLKFYDFSKSLPDYDFFTPTPEEDTDLLVPDIAKETVKVKDARAKGIRIVPRSETENLI